MRWRGFEPSRDVPARSLRSLRGLRLVYFKSLADIDSLDHVLLATSRRESLAVL
ncbi:hypothetical protein AArcCO_2468 [Halalkaliarchaeum sp. AArc-CO]|nr:hypothetical protein AArcCO_2468 [Halalkaliarchaeum sp. AArc-CO]